MARSSRSRRRLTLLGILLGTTVAVGGGSYAGVKWYRARQIEAARVEGYAKFEAGDYVTALDRLSAYVAKHQDDADAILRLAKCRAKVFAPNRRHFVDAAYFYREVLKLRPGNLEALDGLIESYRELGYGPELLQAADDLLRVDPRNVKAIQVREALAEARGSFEEAVVEARKLIDIEPNAYTWRAIALEAMRQGGSDLATRRALLQGWIDAGEPDGRYRLMMAALEQEAGSRDGAVREARAAAAKGMPDAKMLSVLVELLDTLGLSDEVEGAIEKARSGGVGEQQIVTMQVERHWLAGRFAEARKHLARVEKPEPAFAADLLRWKILVAEGERDTMMADAAVAELRTLLQGKAGEEAGRAEAGILWLDAIQTARGADGVGTFRPAIAMGLLQRAIASNPRDLLLLIRAGDVSMSAGEADEAVRYYTEAFEQANRRWIAAGVKASSALLAVGRTEDGFRFARDLSRRFPTSPSAYFILAQACDALAREGRTPASVDASLPRDIKASTLLSALYDALGKSPTFVAPLIGTLASEGDHDEATRLANVAIADPKTSVESLLQIALLLADRRYGETPVKALEAATGRAGDALEVVVARARLQIARGDFAGAKLIAVNAIAKATDPVQKARRGELLRINAEAAIAAGDANVAAILSELLRDAGDDLESIDFLLAQPAAWEDEALVNAAIAKLGEQIGVASPRSILTDAARVLRFRRTVPQDVAKAIQSVDAILASNPESTVAMVTLARLFAVSQPPNLGQAIAYLQKAVNLQPGRRDLYPELIALMQAAGDFPGASNYLQQYMRSAESDPGQSRVAAGLMVQQGQYLSALPALERVATQTGSEADLVALADAERRSGRADEAERAYRKALDGPDRSALSAMAYSEFLARAGRLDDARRMIDDDAKREKPALTPANRAYLLARMELDYGDAARAGAAVKQALELAPNSAGVALLAAREKLASGDAKAALEFARKGLAIAPQDQHLLTFVASLLMADGSSRADSAQTLDQLTAQNPALGELLQVVKACAAPDGSVAPGPEQLAALVELTSKYPAEPSVWTVAVQLHVAANKVDDAIRIARRGMARLPNEAGPAEYAARLLLQDRRPEEAREAAKAWRALSADSPLEPDLLLARIALIAGKPADAVTTLQPYASRLVAEAAKAPESLGLYAAALLFSGKGEAAFDAVKDGLAKEVSAPDRRLLTEWLRAIRTASTEQAFDALRRSESILAAEDTGRVALATEYVALARRKNAAAALEFARRHLDATSGAAKELPVVQLLGAEVAAVAGDVEAANRVYTATWESIPAEARERLLRWSGLDDATRQSLAGPRSIALFASNNQASMLAKAGTDLDNALSTIERALAMAPDDPAVLETKAEVLLARKEYDAARQILAQLATKDPSALGLRVTLAKVELAAGRVDEARRLVEAVSAAVAEDPFADRVLVEQIADLRRDVAGAGAKSTAAAGAG